MTTFSTHRRRGRLGAVLLVAIAVAAAAGVWPFDVSRGERSTPESTRQALVRAMGSRRTIEARLTGFAYGPFAGAAATGGPLPAEVSLALASIEQQYESDDSPRNEALWATATLVAGDVARALELFDGALGQLPDNAEAWNDAAATYLTAASQNGWHELWVHALDAAERARTLQPGMPEATFNRALALEGLQMREQAAKAWTEALALETQPAWIAEAQRHVQQLGTPSEQAAWENLRQRLDRELPTVSADSESSARAFRHRLRVWIEQELIPAWGHEMSAARTSPTAAASLAKAQAAAELLRRVGGDTFAFESLDRAGALLRTNPALARELASSHVTFAAAAGLSDSGQYDRAASELARIAPIFRSARSPYAGFEHLYSGIALYMGRRLPEARARLEQIASGSTSHLAGQKDWMRGLLAGEENHLQQARDYYHLASQAFSATGEKESTARISALLAEVSVVLGNFREGWTYQRTALAEAPAITVPRRKHVVLYLAGELSQRAGAPLATLVFQNAVLDAAQASAEHAPSLIGGYLQRARIYTRLGRIAEAADDLGRARKLLGAVDAPLLRQNLSADIDTMAAEIEIGVAPESAVAAASRALLHFSTMSGEFRSSALHLQRGRAELAMGQVDRARADFETAIGHFETMRQRVIERRARQRLFRDGWNAFSEMAALSVRTGDEASRALDYAERARARTLLESLMGSSASPDPVALMARELPDGVAVLHYTMRPDRVWLWVVTKEEIRFLEHRVALPDLQLRIRRVERLLGSGRRMTARERAVLLATLKSLFRDLIEPARNEINAVGNLVVVPDGPLHTLPFSALVAPDTGRFLVQTHVVAVAPSLTAFRRVATASRPERVRALVVGEPATPAEARRAPLPFAREEAESLANVYPGAKILLQRAATVRAFTSEAPRADVIHYAGHAFVDIEEPDRSSLLLAPDETDPAGTLFVHQLKASSLLRRPLVVLAACSTNRGRIEVGEGVLSLARPFLEAGAADVVATLWDVEDRAGATLFTPFHKRIAGGMAAASALAATQRELIEAGGETADPPNWAWAVVIGARMR